MADQVSYTKTAGQFLKFRMILHILSQSIIITPRNHKAASRLLWGFLELPILSEKMMERSNGKLHLLRTAIQYSRPRGDRLSAASR